MLESLTVLTPLHYIYLIGVIVILGAMIARKDTPAVCIVFLFLLGVAGLGSIVGGIQTVFRSILHAAIQFMEVIATIALVTAFSKCLSDLGSDRLLMKPMACIMKGPSVTWWVLGLTMLVFSLFLWPSPSVALVGAIMLPFALKAGLHPLAAAMAMNLFGHGIALSYDFVIQGAPAITASASGIPSARILSEGRPLFLTMSLTTVITAFLLNRRTLICDTASVSILETTRSAKLPARGALFLAILTPLAFLGDITAMLFLDLKGGDATSIVSGTAVILMCIGALVGFQKQALEKITTYITDGFLFAIRIFAPVIVIGAFFFLGGDGIVDILGDGVEHGIMNDWAVWLAQHAPLNSHMAALIQMIVGSLTGLDGSGFSGLPLVGSMAQTFGTAVLAPVPVLAALGQITAVFVGGGTIVPWGIIPVAAICNIDPMDLARKNLLPVFIGFVCTFLVACFLL